MSEIGIADKALRKTLKKIVVSLKKSERNLKMVLACKNWMTIVISMVDVSEKLTISDFCNSSVNRANRTRVRTRQEKYLSN
jgi:hypothetical protein